MTEPPTAAAGREGGLPPPGGSGRSEYAYEYDYPLDALVDAAVEAAESVARDESAPPPQFGIEPIDTDDALPAATGPSGETWEVVRQAQGKVTIARARPLCLHPTAHHHNPCAPWLKVAKETLAEAADGKCFALLDPATRLPPRGARCGLCATLREPPCPLTSSATLRSRAR